MLEWQEDFSVAHEGMDTIHMQFVVLLNKAASAEKAEFVSAFEKLLTHTREHFAYEDELLRTHRAASAAEHRAEHEQILGEMTYFYEKALAGRAAFARAYVKEKLPHWIRQHTTTMDAELSRTLRCAAERDFS